jgi:hypothetical protein
MLGAILTVPYLHLTLQIKPGRKLINRLSQGIKICAADRDKDLQWLRHINSPR